MQPSHEKSFTLLHASPACGSFTKQRVFELDSPVHMLHLYFYYYKVTGDDSVFLGDSGTTFERDGVVDKNEDDLGDEFPSAMEIFFDLLETEMFHTAKSPYALIPVEQWGFKPVLDQMGNKRKHRDQEQRDQHARDVRLRIGLNDNAGPLSNAKVQDAIGLVWSHARPSDDHTEFGYNIPQNLHLAAVLRSLVKVAEKLLAASNVVDGSRVRWEAIRDRGRELADKVCSGVREHGVVRMAEAVRREERGQGFFGKKPRGRAEGEFADGELSVHDEKSMEQSGQSSADEVEDFDLMYAFEVDGFGGFVALDDANMPNLLWLPLLERMLGFSGCFPSLEKNRLVYENTRRFVTSDKNRYWFTAAELLPLEEKALKEAERAEKLEAAKHQDQQTATKRTKPPPLTGLGSPHISMGLRQAGLPWQCERNCIWPLGLIAQGWSAQSEDEKRRVLLDVLRSDGGTNLLHEGFDGKDPKHFNRDSFGWANSFFSQWVLEDWLGFGEQDGGDSGGIISAAVPQGDSSRGASKARIVKKTARRAAAHSGEEVLSPQDSSRSEDSRSEQKTPHSADSASGINEEREPTEDRSTSGAVRATSAPRPAASPAEVSGSDDSVPTSIAGFRDATKPYHLRVKAAVQFCFHEYHENSWGYDEIDAVSGHGRDWAGLAITLLDSLDTLWIVGLKDEFHIAVQWVEEHFLKNSHTGLMAPHFEITIRALGGLLGAHSVSGEKILLQKARELGRILNQQGYPYEEQILPEYAITVKKSADEKSAEEIKPRRSLPGSWEWKSTLAAAGSQQLEYRYMEHWSDHAKSVGQTETSFEKLSDRPDRTLHAVAEASRQLIERAKHLLKNQTVGLVPPCLVQSSDSPHISFLDNRACGGAVSLGSMNDSYYEYLLKVYVQDPFGGGCPKCGSPGTNNWQYRDLWLLAMREAKQTLVQRTEKGHVYLSRLGRSNNKAGRVMEHLDCFVPGMLMLGAAVLEQDLTQENLELREHLQKKRENRWIPPDTTAEELNSFRDLAAQLTETCYHMYKMSPIGLAPDSVVFVRGNEDEEEDLARRTARSQNSKKTEKNAGTKDSYPPRSSRFPDMRFGSTHNLLRPELVESLYYMHYFGGENGRKYVRWGEEIFDDFVKWSAQKHGFAPMEGVHLDPAVALGDIVPIVSRSSVHSRAIETDGTVPLSIGYQESFWLAETLKYFYLLFAPTEEKLDPRKWVFSTEAHPLRRFAGVEVAGF